MGQSTTPDGIVYPSDVDKLTPVTFGPLQNIFEAMANSIQTAMTNKGPGATPLTWTPVFTNVDLGDEGTVFGEAYRIGDLVYIVGGFSLGSDSSITGDVSVELPVDAPIASPISVNGVYFSADTSDIYEIALLGGGTTAALTVKDSSTHSYVALTPLNATDPVAFDDGDFVAFSALYVETPVPLI
jgi:hypothetical protein